LIAAVLEFLWLLPSMAVSSEAAFHLPLMKLFGALARNLTGHYLPRHRMYESESLRFEARIPNNTERRVFFWIFWIPK
jgi:hypothetical protein